MWLNMPVYLMLYKINIKVQNKYFMGKKEVIIHMWLKYSLQT